jgi:hypothetical protein
MQSSAFGHIGALNASRNKVIGMEDLCTLKAVIKTNGMYNIMDIRLMPASRK